MALYKSAYYYYYYYYPIVRQPLRHAAGLLLSVICNFKILKIFLTADGMRRPVLHQHAKFHVIGQIAAGVSISQFFRFSSRLESSKIRNFNNP